MRNRIILVSALLLIVSVVGCSWLNETTVNKLQTTIPFTDAGDADETGLSWRDKRARLKEKRLRELDRKEQMAELRRGLPSDSTTGRLLSEFRRYIDGQ